MICCQKHEKVQKISQNKDLHCQQHASQWAKTDEQIRAEIEKLEADLADNAKNIDAKLHQEEKLDEEICQIASRRGRPWQ